MITNMGYAFSSNLDGLSTKTIRVEVNIKRGIPRFTIVGLAAASIKESTERVHIAIENSGFFFPMQSILVTSRQRVPEKMEAGLIFRLRL